MRTPQPPTPPRRALQPATALALVQSPGRGHRVLGRQAAGKAA